MDMSSACGVSLSCSVDSVYDLKQPYAHQMQSRKTAKAATEDSIIEKLGKALARILHVHDVQLQLSGRVSLSVGDKLPEEFSATRPKLLNATQENFNKCVSFPCVIKEQANLVSVGEKLFEDFNAFQPKILNATIQEDSSKRVSFPCAEKEPLYHVSVDEKDEVANVSLHTESHIKSETVDEEDEVADMSLYTESHIKSETVDEEDEVADMSLCTKSHVKSETVDEKDEVADMSLHHKSHINSENVLSENPTSECAPKQLISAMKGSREARGMPLKKLSVTWAPDVYDPPTTSHCHTLRSHSQHRSRSKKSSKHKHKGKSSHGSSSSSSSSSSKRHHQKHVGRSDLRSKSFPSMGRPFVSTDDHSTLQLVDFADSDSKYASSNSVADVHAPVMEATT